MIIFLLKWSGDASEYSFAGGVTPPPPPNVLSRFLMEAVPCEMPSLMYGCGQYVSLIT